MESAAAQGVVHDIMRPILLSECLTRKKQQHCYDTLKRCQNGDCDAVDGYQLLVVLRDTLSESMTFLL